jgi:hypothetical protein
MAKQQTPFTLPFPLEKGGLLPGHMLNHRRRVPSVFFHLQDKQSPERIHLSSFFPWILQFNHPKLLLGVGAQEDREAG